MDFICYIGKYPFFLFYFTDFFFLSLLTRACMCVAGYDPTSAGELRSQKRVCMIGKHCSTQQLLFLLKA